MSDYAIAQNEYGKSMTLTATPGETNPPNFGSGAWTIVAKIAPGATAILNKSITVTATGSGAATTLTAPYTFVEGDITSAIDAGEYLMWMVGTGSDSGGWEREFQVQQSLEVLAGP
jgi:hypothetical protein